MPKSVPSDKNLQDKQADQPIPLQAKLDVHAGMRHPLIGCMKGTVTIADGVDLTEPACLEWADLIDEKFPPLDGTSAGPRHD